MIVKPVSEENIEKCKKCGEMVIKCVTKAGTIFYATVYQEGYYLGVIVKNSFVVEHRHI